MSYDERSQIYGPCVAGPNSGYNTTATGILQYRTLGLNTTQLILGVPWYGYNYPCLSLSDDHVCSIEKVPFRGVDCSDAAGTCIYTYTCIIMCTIIKILSTILCHAKLFTCIDIRNTANIHVWCTFHMDVTLISLAQKFYEQN